LTLIDLSVPVFVLFVFYYINTRMAMAIVFRQTRQLRLPQVIHPVGTTLEEHGTSNAKPSRDKLHSSRHRRLLHLQLQSQAWPRCWCRRCAHFCCRSLSSAACSAFVCARRMTNRTQELDSSVSNLVQDVRNPSAN